MKIPKIVYLYWGNHKLSWLRYLTVKSFIKLNPDWQIKIYYPKTLDLDFHWSTDEHKTNYDGQNWWSKLRELPGVEFIEFDIYSLGFRNYYSEVHKSDIFRLWVLYTFGGLYSDFDILFLKPVDLKDYELVISCHGDYPTGFMGGVKGHFLFEQLLEKAKTIRTDTYQRVGPELLVDYFKDKSWSNELGVWDIPDELIYPYDWQQVEKIFGNGNLPTGIGLHWFGGSTIAAKWENVLTPQNYKDHKILISKVINNICSQ